MSKPFNVPTVDPAFGKEPEEWEYYIQRLAIGEVRRHASVSTENRHYCNSCFCCACVDFLEDYDYNHGRMYHNLLDPPSGECRICPKDKPQ